MLWFKCSDITVKMGYVMFMIHLLAERHTVHLVVLEETIVDSL